MAKIRRTREERKQERSERREGRKRLNVVNNKIGEVTIAKEGTRKGQLESKPTLTESKQSNVDKAIEAAKSMYKDIGLYDENDFLWSKMQSAANPTEVFKLAKHNVYRDAYGKDRRDKVDMSNARYPGSQIDTRLMRYFDAAIPGYGSDIVNEKINEPVRKGFNREAMPSLERIPAANIEYSFPEETPVSSYNSNQLIESMSKDKTRKQERELRQEERRSERYDNKRERRGERLSKSIAKSDIELKKNAASKFMADNPAVGQTLSQITQGKGFGSYTPPTTTDVNNSAIQSQANSIPTAGMQLTSAVANNPNATLTDLNKLSEATTAVNNAQNQQDAAIANQAITTNNVVAETPKTEIPAVASQVTTDEVANAAQNEIPSMPINPAGAIDNAGTQPTERIGGDGQTAVQQMKGGNVTFDQGLTKNKVQDQVTSGAFQGFTNSPVVAIEKLGVQDYFPNAGESIAAGSYSGKYIGNTTIFAAPGARVPFGLYDARMRALKEAAADKQKAIDKILTVPQTEAQYQQQLNDSFFGEGGIDVFIAKHGNNPDAILNDPEFQEWMANKQAKARDITQAVAFAKTTLDEYAKTGSYIPDKVRDISMKLLYGQAPDFKEYLEGKGTLSKLVEDNVVYMNIFPQVQEYAKTALSPDRLTQSPINMKTGGKYDSETFNKERSQFMTEVMNGTVVQGTDVYASGIAKYFTGDYEASIRAIAAGQNASDEQVEEAIKMFTGMIPKESIIFDYTNIKTDELGWAQHYQHIKEWNKEQQDKDMSFAGTLDGGASDAVHPKTGKTFNQEIADLSKSGLTGTARENKLKEIYKIYMGAMNGSTVETDANGTIVSTTPLPDIKAIQGDPNKRTYTVLAETLEGRKWMNLTATEISRMPPNVKLSIGGKRIENNSDYATIMEKPVSLQGRKAFYSNGKFDYLSDYNVDEYAKAPKGSKVTLETERVQTYIVKTMYDADGKPYQDYEAIPGQFDGDVYNISNPSGQQMVDDRVGFNTWQAAQVQGGGQTTVSSGSTRPQ